MGGAGGIPVLGERDQVPTGSPPTGKTRGPSPAQPTPPPSPSQGCLGESNVTRSSSSRTAKARRPRRTVGAAAPRGERGRRAGGGEAGRCQAREGGGGRCSPGRQRGKVARGRAGAGRARPERREGGGGGSGAQVSFPAGGKFWRDSESELHGRASSVPSPACLPAPAGSGGGGSPGAGGGAFRSPPGASAASCPRSSQQHCKPSSSSSHPLIQVFPSSLCTQSSCYCTYLSFSSCLFRNSYRDPVFPSLPSLSHLHRETSSCLLCTFTQILHRFFFSCLFTHSYRPFLLPFARSSPVTVYTFLSVVACSGTHTETLCFFLFLSPFSHIPRATSSSFHPRSGEPHWEPKEKRLDWATSKVGRS